MHTSTDGILFIAVCVLAIRKIMNKLKKKRLINPSASTKIQTCAQISLKCPVLFQSRQSGSARAFELGVTAERQDA